MCKISKTVCKMSKLILEQSGVKYPQKEKAFVITADKSAPFSNATIGVTYPHPGYSIDRGSIKNLTDIEFIVEGEGEIFINGKWERAVAGDTYILAPNEAHKYRSSSRAPWKKYWINYASDYMGAYLRAYGIETGIYKVSTLMNFEKLQRLVSSPEISFSDAYSIVENVHEIINTVAKYRTDFDTPERIRSLLASSVYSKISLERIADELHVSKSSIIRTFKKKYGISPYRFHLNLKIDAAKALLITTRLSVHEISEKLQIVDEHYFSTLFYRKTGLRPLEYRRSIDR